MNQQTQDFPTKSLAISTNSPVISTNPCSVPTTCFRKSTNWDLPTNSPSISTNFPVIPTNPCSVPTTFFRKSTTPRFSYKVSSDINKFPGNIYKSSRDIYKFPIQINKLKARIYKSQPAIDNGPLFRRSLPFSMRSATLFIDFVWHPFDFFFCLFINSERLCIYYHEEVVFWLLLRIMKQKLNY